MAKLLLQSNEFTVETLLLKIQKEHKAKGNGSNFSKADIHDWANKQRIPKQYGGEYVRVAKLGPLKILMLSESQHKDYKVQEVEIAKQ